jgi:hypothetical protein
MNLSLKFVLFVCYIKERALEGGVMDGRMCLFRTVERIVDFLSLDADVVVVDANKFEKVKKLCKTVPKEFANAKTKNTESISVLTQARFNTVFDSVNLDMQHFHDYYLMPAYKIVAQWYGEDFEKLHVFWLRKHPIKPLKYYIYNQQNFSKHQIHARCIIWTRL